MIYKACCVAIASVAGLALPASAGLMDTLFENSLTYSVDGLEIVEHYNPDGSFSNNQGAQGSWSYEDGVLCSIVDDTAECGSVPDDLEVGETVNVTLEDGRNLEVKLQSGR